MSIDTSYIERSEGAKLIVEHCEDLADELNIELVKTPYWVLPIVDAILVDDSGDLIIETSSGSAKVKISREELEDYPVKTGNKDVKEKIKGALEMLTAKS